MRPKANGSVEVEAHEEPPSSAKTENIFWDEEEILSNLKIKE